MYNITIKGLSSRTLGKAAAEVRAYKARVEELAQKLVAELAAQGVQIALVEAEGIRDTGKLLSSIVGESGGNYGYVKCKCGYAVFVEFGTGVVGKGKPHPNVGILGSCPPPSYKGHTYTGYDSQGHGELGWWYPGDDGTLYWTQGMPSRPFMYNTAQQLKQLVVPTAKGLI